MVLAYCPDGPVWEIVEVGTGFVPGVGFLRYRLVAHEVLCRCKPNALSGCLVPFPMRTQMVVRMASVSAVAVGLLCPPFPMWVLRTLK